MACFAYWRRMDFLDLALGGLGFVRIGNRGRRTTQHARTVSMTLKIRTETMGKNRLEAFSDGVIAIIITIMELD
jgi:hypothetical protein